MGRGDTRRVLRRAAVSCVDPVAVWSGKRRMHRADDERMRARRKGKARACDVRQGRVVESGLQVDAGRAIDKSDEVDEVFVSFPDKASCDSVFMVPELYPGCHFHYPYGLVLRNDGLRVGLVALFAHCSNVPNPPGGPMNPRARA